MVLFSEQIIRYKQSKAKQSKAKKIKIRANQSKAKKIKIRANQSKAHHSTAKQIKIRANQSTTKTTIADYIFQMDTASFISVFSNETQIEWLSGVSEGKCVFGREEKLNAIGEGDTMLLYNQDTQQIFGIAKIAGGCYKPALNDARNLYADPKFNKYEIPFSKLSLFAETMHYRDFIRFLQIPEGIKTLFKLQHLIISNSFKLWPPADAETTANVMSLLSLFISTHV